LLRAAELAGLQMSLCARFVLVGRQLLLLLAVLVVRGIRAALVRGLSAAVIHSYRNRRQTIKARRRQHHCYLLGEILFSSSFTHLL
jgi:hypothetical protein